MRRKKVSSSCILSLGYDPARQWLEVEYPAGAVYRYLKVPNLVYLRIMNACSLGREWNRSKTASNTFRSSRSVGSRLKRGVRLWLVIARRRYSRAKTERGPIGARWAGSPAHALPRNRKGRLLSRPLQRNLQCGAVQPLAYFFSAAASSVLGGAGSGAVPGSTHSRMACSAASPWRGYSLIIRV
jgi:hypothetical protein